MTVIVQITPESLTEEMLSRFEAQIGKCPNIRGCYLMTGSADYLLRIEAKDIADFERTHKEALSRLSGVARIQSHFALCQVAQRQRVPTMAAPQKMLNPDKRQVSGCGSQGEKDIITM
ncbi:Lrp/AsnC family transcriptional regulator [Acetobacter oeni]|uniref:Transcription regulator AsnC/Lrp ligand binding domain-containing protein n=1 Tax=Acetobacter oeni TaxID=304077 RepID=A0A511XNR5_9PROT|nr:Lrp/AsnC ligand binding domain-containing protein [Acetobacter oeni]MBB3884401.1 DNA-binding Lrp family transcriptional regulator [Acetobacter oeni]NHO20377.1 Lrp/AsnC family transcriptional regulator [Acetobacter oeni]GBR09843.1 AsnC family transcriptional regulator [Acetobacter oeni LMG 21952]GEN64598.1 hypothetical protein AOE01nite_28220 [Acetobacter oeni]